MDHLDTLRTNGGLLADAARTAGLEVPVTGADLVERVAAVVAVRVGLDTLCPQLVELAEPLRLLGRQSPCCRGSVVGGLVG